MNPETIKLLTDLRAEVRKEWMDGSGNLMETPNARIWLLMQVADALLAIQLAAPANLNKQDEAG